MKPTKYVECYVDGFWTEPDPSGRAVNWKPNYRDLRKELSKGKIYKVVQFYTHIGHTLCDAWDVINDVGQRCTYGEHIFRPVKMTEIRRKKLKRILK
jgi:hypothetical protein